MRLDFLRRTRGKDMPAICRKLGNAISNRVAPFQKIIGRAQANTEDRRIAMAGANRRAGAVVALSLDSNKPVYGETGRPVRPQGYHGPEWNCRSRPTAFSDPIGDRLVSQLRIVYLYQFDEYFAVAGTTPMTRPAERLIGD